MPDPMRFNRQLSVLSPWAHRRIQEHLGARALLPDDLLYDVQMPTEEVYFPVSGGIALLTLTEDGGSVVAELVGPEGILGAWLSLGLRRSPWRAVALTAVEAEVVPAEVFVSLLRDEPDFRQRMQTYARGLFDATMHSITCSRLHPPSARAAKWLTLLLERSGLSAPAVSLTHLGVLLGAPEEAVAAALQSLLRARMIEDAGGGCIRIVDREALRTAACE
jgi:CRP-like cAMP-binding protein